MLIATFNVNGIRAATRRGFADWLAKRSPAIVAIQEMRCPDAKLPDVFAGYHLNYHSGNLPGRNGVALLTKAEPSRIQTGFNHVSDPEGRYLEIDLPGLTVASLYLPKGDVLGESDAQDARYHRKMNFMKVFAEYLLQATEKATKEGKQYLVMGDFNIAHQKIDLKNWRSNQKSDGFLLEEREWFEKVLQTGRLVDVVRSLHEGQEGPYSWWTWRGKAFDNDSGWRIDYHLATPGLAELATSAWTDKDRSFDERISDHAPVFVDYGSFSS